MDQLIIINNGKKRLDIFICQTDKIFKGFLHGLSYKSFTHDLP